MRILIALLAAGCLLAQRPLPSPVAGVVGLSSANTWTGSQTWLGNVAFGDMYSPDSTRPITMTHEFTHTSGARRLMYLETEFSPPSNSSGSLNSISIYQRYEGSHNNTAFQYPVHVVAEVNGTGTYSDFWIIEGDFFNQSTATIDEAGALVGWISNAGTINKAYGAWLGFDLAGTVPNVYGVYVARPITYGDTSITALYGLYAENLVGMTGVTNPYFLWYNGTGANAGVWRVNELGIVAYYNPSFADYTPGAANFERIVTQWNANVAEIGTEAGGTGTSRGVRLIGASLAVASLTATGSATGKTVVCADTNGVLYRSSTGTDCSN